MSAVAVDRHGVAWIALGGTIVTFDPASRECTPKDVTIEPTARLMRTEKRR